MRQAHVEPRPLAMLVQTNTSNIKLIQIKIEMGSPRCSTMNVPFSFNSMDRLVQQIDRRDAAPHLQSMKISKPFFLHLVALGSSQTIRMAKQSRTFFALNKIRRFYGHLKCHDHYSIDDNGDDSDEHKLIAISYELNVILMTVFLKSIRQTDAYRDLPHQSQSECIKIRDFIQSAIGI